MSNTSNTGNTCNTCNTENTSNTYKSNDTYCLGLKLICLQNQINMQAIKEDALIQNQPDWIKRFLSNIRISQAHENMPIREMEAAAIEEKNGTLHIKLILRQSDNYHKRAQDFEKGNCLDELYVENRTILNLWFSNKHVKFSWQEAYYTNSAAKDPFSFFKSYINQQKHGADFPSITPYEAFKFTLDVEGVCTQTEVKISKRNLQVNINTPDQTLACQGGYQNYPYALQHFLKELCWHLDDWQQYFFKGNERPSWKGFLKGPEDVILESSFEEYVVRVYASSFWREDLLGLSPFVYGQLVEISAANPIKFQVLKVALLEYYRVEEKWPKDMLEVILLHYSKTFAEPLTEFEEQIIFIAIRYFDFPFIPDKTENYEFFDQLGECRIGITFGDYSVYFNDYLEWKEWVDAAEIKN